MALPSPGPSYKPALSPYSITLTDDEQSADATRLREVILLDLAEGAEVTIAAEGENAEGIANFLAMVITQLE